MRSPTLRLSLFLSAIALVCAAAALVVEGQPLVYVAFVGWPAGGLALVVALVDLAASPRGATEKGPLSRGAIATVALAVMVFTLQTILVPLVYDAASDHSKVTVSRANLGGVAEALKLYCDEQGDYPHMLDVLVARGDITNKLLVAPNDARLRNDNWRKEDPPYRSYIYCPGSGRWRDEPHIVLACENGTWSPLECRLFSDRGRLVLFSNGGVRVVCQREFREAVQASAARRAELGWPACQVDPKATGR